MPRARHRRPPRSRRYQVNAQVASARGRSRLRTTLSGSGGMSRSTGAVQRLKAAGSGVQATGRHGNRGPAARGASGASPAQPERQAIALRRYRSPGPLPTAPGSGGESRSGSQFHRFQSPCSASGARSPASGTVPSSGRLFGDQVGVSGSGPRVPGSGGGYGSQGTVPRRPASGRPWSR